MEATTAAAKFRAGKAASAASTTAAEATTTAAEATTPTEATAANCGTTATAAACLRAKLGETFGRCGHWQNQADRCQCE